MPEERAGVSVAGAEPDPFDDSLFNDESLESASTTSTTTLSEEERAVVVSASVSAKDEEDSHYLAYYARDPHLLRHKAIYFLGMGANAAYFPFAVQWWTTRIGLTIGEAGIVFATAHMFTALFSPLVMRLADQGEGWRKGVLVVSLVLQIVFLGVMSTCRGFWSVLVVEVLQECCGSAIWPSMDATTQRLLEVVHGSTVLYGNTRAFGALGWGLCAWVYGAIYDQVGLDVWWQLYAFTLFPAVFIAASLPMERRSATKVDHTTFFWQLLRWEVMVVLLVVFLSAVLLQIVDIYRFPFLMSLPGCTNQLLGFSITATAASEAPFFFITSWILSRMSVGWALCIVLAGYCIRMVYYSLIYDPWLTIPAELMHGITFALGWAAATQYMAQLLPPELSSSAQGLLSGIQWGVGAAVGSLAGGQLESAYGWRAMWRWSAALAFAGLLVMLWELRRVASATASALPIPEDDEEEGEEANSPNSRESAKRESSRFADKDDIVSTCPS